MPESFVPRWASPPGTTVQELADRQSLRRSTLAGALELTEVELNGVIEGRTSISMQLAERLADVLGASPRFWLTRDAQYHEDLARVAADRWSSSLPLTDMCRWGWISKPKSWQERIEYSLEFFGVEDLEEWESTYRHMLATARYRTTTAFETSEAATATWIRQAEVIASQVSLGRWQRGELKKSLPHLRRLTREPNPRVFIPELRGTLAKCGVSLVVLPAPKRCRASGVSTVLPSGNPLVILSARYLSDDHFWFTLFHELAHTLLHDLRRASVDEIEPVAAVPVDDDERHADALAAEVLIDPTLQPELRRLRNRPRDIVRFARVAETSPGVVVGQLQRLGLLDYNQGNSMKRRYRWEGVSLEMA